MNEILFKISEIFSSIQGEGSATGLSCTFIRFFGCNLECKFCDTPQGKHGSYFRLPISRIIEKARKFRNYTIVLTGGEPCFQPISSLILSLVGEFRIHLETNGTIELPEEIKEKIHLISLSPKVPFERCKIITVQNLKLLYPYLPGCTPDDYKEVIDFNWYSDGLYIQPIMTGDRKEDERNLWSAMNEVKQLGFPWKLGVQLHKLMGVR